MHHAKVWDKCEQWSDNSKARQSGKQENDVINYSIQVMKEGGPRVE